MSGAESNAPVPPRSGVFRHVFRLLLLFYLVLAILAFAQVRRTRRIYPVTSPGEDEWRGKGVEFVLGKPGRFYPPCPMVGREKGGDWAGVNPALQVRLPPPRNGGYALNIGALFFRFRNPPVLSVTVNDVPVGTFTPRKSPEPVNGEIEIPSSLLNPGQVNSLRLENDSTGGWVGTLLLIPYAPMHRVLRHVLPPAAAILLLLLAWPAGARWRWLRPLAVFGAGFPLYLHSLLSYKLAPLGGLLFSDSTEFVLPLFNNEASFDMLKHLLYLPVLHYLWLAFRLVGQPDLLSYALASACVSALNLAVVFLWFRRLCRTELMALLWTVVYGFSFAVWVCASIYETFTLSSLMVHFVLLAVAGVDRVTGLRDHGRVGVLVGLAGLAHPPLLVLMGLYAGRLFLLPGAWMAKVLRVVTVTALSLLVFLAGQQVIVATSATSEGGFGGSSLVFAQNAVDNYASVDHFNVADAGNVVLGQFVHALVGRRPGFDWSDGWYTMLRWGADPGSATATFCWLCLLVAGLIGLGRDAALRRHALAGVLLVLLPYLGFFLYFNPGEMVLYSPPLLGLVLGAVALGSRQALGDYPWVWVSALAAALVVSNTLVIAAYA